MVPGRTAFRRYLVSRSCRSVIRDCASEKRPPGRLGTNSRHAAHWRSALRDGLVSLRDEKSNIAK